MFLVVDELLDVLLVLLVHLSLQEVRDLHLARPVFAALLLVGHCEFFVALVPEGGELLIFLDCSVFLLLPALNLDLAAFVDRLLHFQTAALLLLEQAVRLVFRLRHLLVEQRLLVGLLRT